MKPPAIELGLIRQLGEPCFRARIPAHWADANGHMNMRWYAALFDDGGDELHNELGLTQEFHREHGTGTMDLEHHTHFLNEVMPNSEISIYVRAVDQNAKRLHYLLFLVDDERGKLASIFECINAFVDLGIRKTAPWPEEIRVRIEEMVARHRRLSWAPPVSGAMSA